MASSLWHEVEAKLDLVEAWARDGDIDKTIAERLGIGYRTLCEYKVKYPQMSQALKKGKEVIDVQVENTLLKRALGYYYDEITEETSKDAHGNKYTKRKVVTKHVVPDTVAQFFWLKNRKPDKWRDRAEIDHNILPPTIIDDIPKSGNDDG